jgi:two-component system sensor histidine kinase BaeS
MLKSLSSRAALLTGTIAAVAVLIAGLVALPLIRDAADVQAQANLASQADLVRNVALEPEDFEPNQPMGMPANSARALQGVILYLRAQGIVVAAVIPGSTEPAILTKDQIAIIAKGDELSTTSCVQENCFFVVGRPVGLGTGVILIQSTDLVASETSTAIKRIALALVTGFAVAILIGLFAARRLAKPLSEAAAAAHELALGKRDVRLTPEGPTEIFEIAVALNGLAAELSASEGRQREFLLSVSHELRTPLTAIRGYAEAMSDGLITETDQVRVGLVMSSEAQRLDRLVSDLLDLARTGAVDFPLHLQSVDLVDVVSDASDVWRDRAAREGVEFRSDIVPTNLQVFTDPIRVRQIIDNLAENALRVTPEGELIVISLDENAVIQVRDSGPGLSQDDIASAFVPGELFERYKGVRQVGTGFGLALVGRLASRLGASASAGTSSEGGAAFTLDLSSSQVPLN